MGSTRHVRGKNLFGKQVKKLLENSLGIWTWLKLGEEVIQRGGRRWKESTESDLVLFISKAGEGVLCFYFIDCS